jgi:hypothetical protein
LPDSTGRAGMAAPSVFADSRGRFFMVQNSGYVSACAEL